MKVRGARFEALGVERGRATGAVRSLEPKTSKKE